MNRTQVIDRSPAKVRLAENSASKKIRTLRAQQRKANEDFRFSDADFIDFEIHEVIEELKELRANDYND